MIDPLKFFRNTESSTLDFWNASCETIKDWFSIKFNTNRSTSEDTIKSAETFLGYALPASAKKLIELMTDLKDSDPEFKALDLKPQYSEIKTKCGDFVCLFNFTDDEDIRYGFKKWEVNSTEYEKTEYREHIYCIDFDRVEDDLNEDDPNDSLEEPEVDLFSKNPEAFVLNLLSQRFSDLEDSPLYLSGEIDDEDDGNEVETLLTRQFKQKVTINDWTLWGAEGLFILKYEWSGTQLELIAHSKEIAQKIPNKVFESIGFSAKEVERHSF